jgi:hypothetical protein
MHEFDKKEREMMVETILECLEKGTCKNGMPLSKEAFQIMYALAQGLHVNKLQALMTQ